MILLSNLLAFQMDIWSSRLHSPSNFHTFASLILIQRVSFDLAKLSIAFTNLTQVLAIEVANKQTQTFGELLTLGTIVAPASQFRGPVHVVLGENDLVFCGGDCTQPQDQSALVVPAFYPAASKSQHYIVPGAGHVIFAHYSAPKAFAQMTSFLKTNGL